MGSLYAYRLTDEEASLWRENPRETLNSYRPCARARAHMLGYDGVQFVAPGGQVLAELHDADGDAPMALGTRTGH